MSAIPLRRIEGKYEILEKLREGGMGAIYKVRHRLLDEIRVIKLMRQQLVEDPELKARFLREARLAIKLRHPNIAQLYDFTVDDDGTAFIVMEYIDGLTLEDVLSFHGPPPLGFTLEIAQQALRALGYLHLRGFVHRDISPDNLMLTEDTEGQPLIKLIDLGIAKTLNAAAGESQLTQSGTFLGKLRYAPPEQFGADGASVDARADLYSFGVVFYELLTARFPINGRDPSSLIAGHLFRPPLDFAETDPTGRVPDGLRKVVLKMLEKKPEDRFAGAQELSRVLTGFRTPSDVDEKDLRKLLTPPFVRAETSASTFHDLPPGSTQGRLDQNFDLASTPSPGSLLALTPPVLQETAVYSTEPPVETRKGELSAALTRIEATLEKGDFRVAETLLYAAEASLGQQESFAPLYERIAEQQRRALGEKVGAHLENARRLAAARDLRGALAEALKARRLDTESREAALMIAEIDAGLKRCDEVAALVAAARELVARDDLKGALKELRRAARLDPAEPGVGALIAEIEETSERKREEKRRDQQRAREVKKIEDRLAKGALDAAGELLDKAEAVHGEEALEDLRERLNAIRREARRTQMLNAAVAGIRDSLDRGELETAGELLDQAVARVGAVAPLRELWERLEQMLKAAKAEAETQAAALADRTALRWQKEEKRRAAELLLAVTTIELRLDHADLATAAELLEKAKADFGDQEPLPRLRSRLESLRQKARLAKPPGPTD